MFDWTAQAEQRLRYLIGQGMSASKVAAELGGGLTRNAVIGKCKRLGVRLRGSSRGGPKKKALTPLEVQMKEEARKARKREMERRRIRRKREAEERERMRKYRAEQKARRQAGLPPVPGLAPVVTREYITPAPTNPPISYLEAIMEGHRCQFPTGPIDEDAGPSMQVCGAVLSHGRKGIARSNCDYHVEVCNGEVS